MYILNTETDFPFVSLKTYRSEFYQFLFDLHQMSVDIPPDFMIWH